MCSPLHQPDGVLPAAASSRRRFLRATGLAGAAAAAGFAATATPAAAAQTSVLPGHGTSGSAAPWRPVIRVVERPLPVRDFMNA